MGSDYEGIIPKESDGPTSQPFPQGEGVKAGSRGHSCGTASTAFRGGRASSRIGGGSAISCGAIRGPALVAGRILEPACQIARDWASSAGELRASMTLCGRKSVGSF